MTDLQLSLQVDTALSSGIPFACVGTVQPEGFSSSPRPDTSSPLTRVSNLSMAEGSSDDVRLRTRKMAHIDDPSTSFEAAEKVFPRSGSQRDRVLRLIEEHPEGLIDEQIAVLLKLTRSSAGTRRGELVAKGFVYTDGAKRKTSTDSNALVWKATKFVTAEAYEDLMRIPDHSTQEYFAGQPDRHSEGDKS